MIDFRQEIRAELVTSIHVIAKRSTRPLIPLLGFHGFGEDSETQMERLCALGLSETHAYCSICAPFQVVTSLGERGFGWIAPGKQSQFDSKIVALIDLAMDSMRHSIPNVLAPQLWAFSQGVTAACAYLGAGKYTPTAVALMSYPITAWMAPSLRIAPRTILLTGSHDTWVSPDTYSKSLEFLKREKIPFAHSEYAGEHFPNLQSLELVRDFLSK
jgi:predicted esterase